MKKQRYFIFNPNNCIGCNGCTAACKNSNNTVTELMWRTVHKIPPYDGDNKTYYISMSCNHCENPPCLIGCPTNSYNKRESDGVVIHNPDTCMGCKYCTMACPYGAIKWNPKDKIVNKCHFCFEELDSGGETACIKTCFGGALSQEIKSSEELQEYCNNQIEGINYLQEVNPSIRFVKKNKSSELRNDKKFPPVFELKNSGENDVL